jgi:hypothetical protein
MRRRRRMRRTTTEPAKSSTQRRSTRRRNRARPDATAQRPKSLEKQIEGPSVQDAMTRLKMGHNEPDKLMPRLKSLGAMMAGGNPAKGRNKNDLYCTEYPATIALLNHEEDFIRAHTEHVWEFCAGRGHIARVLKAFGLRPHPTDMFKYPGQVYPVLGTEIDFLKAGDRISSVGITNPPFNVAEEIIRHALGKLQFSYLALLLKSTFWHAKGRTPLFEQFPPSRELQLTWRLDFSGEGKPTMECTWFVWDSLNPPKRGRRGVIHPGKALLPKPSDGQIARMKKRVPLPEKKK